MEVMVDSGVQFLIGSNKVQTKFFGCGKVYCVVNTNRFSGGKFYGQHN